MTRTTYRLLTLGVLTALALGASPAGAEEKLTPGGAGPGDGKMMRPMKADTNGDGFLTKDEMIAAHRKRLDEMFAKTDANKDGKLSREEMKAGRERMKAERKAKREEWKAKREERQKNRDGAGPDGVRTLDEPMGTP
jgi:hypothetical protein